MEMATQAATEKHGGWRTRQLAVTSENENLGGKDGLLVYDYEGQGSSAGSVGCCSLLEVDNDLDFLDDLGTKFKTLAEVCGGKKIPTEVKQVFSLPPSASINTQTSVSSSMAIQQQPPPPKQQPTISTTVVRDLSEGTQVMKETQLSPDSRTATRLILLYQPLSSSLSVNSVSHQICPLEAEICHGSQCVGVKVCLFQCL
uniref:Cadherin Y-type LIR-motif domain-containing protein n=1 Tax=Cyclopterus lumpus TaxID=8103 RepID=A0A8C3AIL2_CYCLU